MDIRQLRQFIAVAEELSFRRAAARLNMAQPPLTAAIQKIEAQVGAPLLERSNKVSKLTEAGQVFLDEARRTIDQLDRTIYLAREAAKGKTRSFRLSFIDSMGNAVLPNILRQFSAVHPEVDSHLFESTTAEQVSAVIEDRVDAAILVLPIEQDLGLKAVTLIRDRMVVALPRTHRLSGRKRVRLAELADETWIIFPVHQGPGLYGEIMKACGSSGFSPKIGQRARQMQTMCGLVAGGIGVALVPRLLASVKPPGTVFLDVIGPSVPYDVALVYKRDSDLVDEFAQIAMTICSRHTARKGEPG